MGNEWSGRKVMNAREYWRGRLRAAGALPCWRCGRPLTVDAPWTVGHVVARAEGGSVTRPGNQWVECKRCNYGAGARLGAQRRNARRPNRIARQDSERARGIRGW